jgi:radical SAM protein with 4Fe4S-binding SPASM domain
MTIFQPVSTIKYYYAFVKEYHTGLLRGALTFLDNTLVYLYDKKPSRGPTFVGWNVLFNCNAVCSFCDTHELHKQLDREMTHEEAMSIVKQLGEAGTWHLSLTGGETLLRKDLPEIIIESKKYGMFVNVNTNGALLAKKAKRLVESGLDSLIISLDSDKPEIHDTAREIPKLTESIFRGIEAVRKAQKESGSNKPEIVLRMIVSKQNYEAIDTYIEKFQHLVDKITIQPIHDGVTAPKFKKNEKLNLFHIKETDIYQFEQKDQSNYRKTFNDLYKKHKWLDNSFIREFETFIFSKDAMWEKYKCYAGYYYMVVDPALDTFPCTFFVDKFESLRNNNLMDIWRGEKIKAWRKLVKNKENTCTCACGIAEVNAVLTPKLENKMFHPFSISNKTEEPEALVK